MPEEQFLTAQLHELLTYLGRQGVTTLMVVAQHGLMGTNMQAPVDTSYLADSVVLLRYFEYGGKVKKAISVVKNAVVLTRKAFESCALTKAEFTSASR